MTFTTAGMAWTRVRLPRQLSRAFKISYVVIGFVSAAFRVLSMSDYSSGFGVLMALTLLVSLVSLSSWGLIVASYILSLTESWKMGDVEVSADGLDVRVAGKARRFVPRSEILGALVVPRRIGMGWGVATVEVELRSGDRLSVRVSDPDAARALVVELGFGPGRARVRSRLAKPSRRVVHLFVAFFLYVLMAVPMAIASMALFDVGSNNFLATALATGSAGAVQAIQLLLYWAITRLMRPPEVVIGDDGIAVHGRRSRFFRANDPGVVAALSGLNIDRERVDAVVREANERLAAASPRAEQAGLFARAGRSMSEWRQHLATAMDQTNYRANARTADDAAAVLRNPAATPDERVGAALALRGVGEPTARVRIAAEAIADDRVRVALEAVADGADDVAVERTLARAARA